MPALCNAKRTPLLQLHRCYMQFVRHDNFNSMLCAILFGSCTARLHDFGDRDGIRVDKQIRSDSQVGRLACQTVSRFGEGFARNVGMKVGA